MKKFKRVTIVGWIISALAVVLITTFAIVAPSDFVAKIFGIKTTEGQTSATQQTVESDPLVLEGHRLLVSGSGHERIAVIDYNGDTLWELKGKDTLWDEVNDAEIDSEGNIVYASHFYNGNSYVRKIKPDYSKSGEYTPVFEYVCGSGAENHTSEILSDGGVLLCETYDDYVKIIELDSLGKVRLSIGSADQKIEGFDTAVGAHNQLRQITKTSYGTYLLAHFTNDYTYEIDKNGNKVDSFDYGKAFVAVKDKNENLIISQGNDKSVVCISPDKSLVWSIGSTDISGITLNWPAAVEPLDNGNIILADWSGHGTTADVAVYEINPTTKELVWSLNSEDSNNVSNIFNLDSSPVDFKPSTTSYRSPVDVVANETTNMVYVADYTNNSISIINAETDGQMGTIMLDSSPNALLLSENGKTLYAACGEVNGVFYAIDTASGTVIGSTEVGYTPCALSFGTDESVVYVANRFDGNIQKVSVGVDSTLTVTKTSEKICREPFALTFANGKLYVAEHLPDMAATEEIVASRVLSVNADTLRTISAITLENGSTAVKDIAASPDGKYVYATHTIGRYWVPTTQIDKGWIYTNALTEISTVDDTVSATMLIDDLDMGAGNPWGISVEDNTVAISVSGTGEVILLDQNAMRTNIDSVKAGTYVGDGSCKTIDDVSVSLTFLSSVKKRVDLGTQGTKGIALLNGKAYAANYYSSNLSVVDMKSAKLIKNIAFDTTVLETDARAGERLWNDADLSFGHWQSCASCHPDARTDALNWDNMNNGIGTPAQTRSMIDSTKRGRVMATGIREDAKVAVAAGVKYILFNAGIPQEDYDRIYAYIDSLQPEQSPYLVDGRLSESAARGKALFYGKAGCVSCHSGKTYGQDKLIYNMTQSAEDERGLLIPPLREVWRTAPYLVDGRAQTVMDVLNEKINAGNTELASLTESELADLEQYILSIDGSQSDEADAVSKEFKSAFSLEKIDLRLEGEQGIRFKNLINKQAFDNGIKDFKIVEIGTLSIKAKNMGTATELYLNETYTVGNKSYTPLSAVVYNDKANKLTLSKEGENYAFNTVLVGIEDYNLKTDYTVRNYAVIKDSYGAEVVVYLDQYTVNMYEFAGQMIDSDTLSKDEQAALNEIISKVK